MDSLKSVTKLAETMVEDEAKKSEVQSREERRMKIHLEFVDLLGLCSK